MSLTSFTSSLSEKAGDYYNEGYCCSESIVLATIEVFKLDTPRDVVQAAAAGLCGGMGGKQATCGVFTGAAMAIGLVIGKGQKKDKQVKELSAELYRRLEQKAGGSQCYDLLEQKGLKNWRGAMCRQLTCDGGEILQRLLEQTQTKKH